MKIKARDAKVGMRIMTKGLPSYGIPGGERTIEMVGKVYSSISGNESVEYVPIKTNADKSVQPYLANAVLEQLA